jgi:hypothetical protein
MVITGELMIEAPHSTRGHDFVAQVGVRDDAQVAARPDEHGRSLFGRHPLRRLPDRCVGIAEDGRTADERRDAHRAHLGQPVHRMPGAHEPFAKRGRDESRTGRAAQERNRDVGRNQIADRVFMRPHGERGSQPSKQGRVTEGLPRLENVDGLVLVNELHRPAPDDVEVGGGRPVLDQSVFPGAVRARLDRPGDTLQLVLGEPRERWMAGEELGNVAYCPRPSPSCTM